MHFARLVNQTLRTHYTVEQMRELLANEMTREDVELVVAYREGLMRRLNERLKHPAVKKNPEAALLGEVMNQLL